MQKDEHSENAQSWALEFSVFMETVKWISGNGHSWEKLEAEGR